MEKEPIERKGDISLPPTKLEGIIQEIDASVSLVFHGGAREAIEDQSLYLETVALCVSPIIPTFTKDELDHLLDELQLVEPRKLEKAGLSEDGTFTVPTLSYTEIAGVRKISTSLYSIGEGTLSRLSTEPFIRSTERERPLFRSINLYIYPAAVFAFKAAGDFRAAYIDRKRSTPLMDGEISKYQIEQAIGNKDPFSDPPQLGRIRRINERLKDLR